MCVTSKQYVILFQNNEIIIYLPDRAETCHSVANYSVRLLSTDINECSSNKGGCQQICNNRRGASRTCSCYRGYKTSPFDSKKCIGKSKFPSFLKCGGLISQLIVPITKYYHINYGVMQGFPALGKVVTTLAFCAARSG